LARRKILIGVMELVFGPFFKYSVFNDSCGFFLLIQAGCQVLAGRYSGTETNYILWIS